MQFVRHPTNAVRVAPSFLSKEEVKCPKRDSLFIHKYSYSKIVELHCMSSRVLFANCSLSF